MLMNQLKSKKGQTMAEYALILVLIAIALVVAFQGLQGGISGALTSIVGNL